MAASIISNRFRAFALATMATLVVIGDGLPAEASPPVPPRLTVDLQPAAGLAPDGQSVFVTVLASCPERWTVLQATVTVSQPQASGEGSFPLTCIDSIRSFSVTVQSSGAPFQLGEAHGTAFVLIKRGRTEQAQDSEIVQVDPTVFVDLADTALLEGGGEAVSIDVTVACPVGSNGQQSYVNVSQGEASGNGNYVPICDGQGHTFNVRVQAFQGLFRVGSAQALTFAFVEEGGDSFSGIDDAPIQIVVG
ncbi:MAG TPA: hypothetical protein VGL18_06895 [Actinomycetota bacterium]|jgi:hypothetical protein